MDTMILLVEGDFSGAWEALKSTVENAMSGIAQAVRGALNIVIDLWNALDFSIDISIPNPAHGTIFDPIGSPSLEIHTGDIIPDIPRLAAGGIVRTPTLAMIGEGSGPEAVVPLERGGMGLGSTTINVYASAANPADVGRSVVEAIEAYERRAGAGWRAA